MASLLSGRRLSLELNENILPVKTLALIWWILLQEMLCSASAIFISVLLDFFVFFSFFFFPSATKDPKSPRAFHRYVLLNDARTCIFSFFFFSFGHLGKKKKECHAGFGAVEFYQLDASTSVTAPSSCTHLVMLKSFMFTNLAAYWVALFWEKVTLSQKNCIKFILYEIFIKWLETVEEVPTWSGNKYQTIQLICGEAQDSVCKSLILILCIRTIYVTDWTCCWERRGPGMGIF